MSWPDSMERDRSGFVEERDFLLHLKRKIENQRVPFSGDLSMTDRCNLRCVHCYLGSRRIVSRSHRRELGTARLRTLLDELTGLGCLFLLITGGEPLLREDFPEIYRHAKLRGLLVTVFTNGTLVTDQILDLWQEFPPQAVEISLYGASQETYEKITGNHGSFKRCLNGIERLVERKIRVRLKTVLMTDNRHEFSEIQAMARRYGVKFRMDAEIFPRFDGDKSPMLRRVPAEEAVDQEFSDGEKARRWTDLFHRSPEPSQDETLYRCGAGVTHFHIDSYGYLYPCMMVQDLKVDLTRTRFEEGWHRIIPRIRERVATSAYPCNRCEKRALCSVCPAYFKLENDTEETRSNYLCTIGRLRFERIMRAAHG